MILLAPSRKLVSCVHSLSKDICDDKAPESILLSKFKLLNFLSVLKIEILEIGPTKFAPLSDRSNATTLLALEPDPQVTPVQVVAPNPQGGGIKLALHTQPAIKGGNVSIAILNSQSASVSKYIKLEGLEVGWREGSVEG